MQSGITASEELQAQFNNLLSTPSQFGLLVTIEKETLTPFATLDSTSNTFSENLAALQPHVKPDVPLYIILRRFDTAPHLLAVTYVPDTAHVRQKMLFASTRLTLVRELGSEHFRETIFATNAEELTPQGFEKHDKHEKLENPLTEEERSLQGVKRAEMVEGRGTGVKEIHLSKTMNMPVGEDVVGALEGLEKGERNVAMLKINAETEVVELVQDSSNPSTITDLTTNTISQTEPRFTFFRYTHTHNGTESSPILFFYTCPAAAGMKSIKHRMLYPLMKRAVLTIAESQAGLKIEKKFEVEELSEISEEGVDGELHPKVVQSRGFSRPKRPGR